MINLGLVQRSLREMWFTSAVFAGLLGLMSGLMAYALPMVQARFMARGFIPPPVQQFRNVMLGFDATGAGVADVAFSIAWSHPAVLALLFAHAIVVCTRVPAGEIERGTIDVLLGLPVSRRTLWLSETAAWLIMGAGVLGAVYLGSFVGARWVEPQYRPNWGNLVMVLANLALVYGAVGTAAMAAASVFDRRGRAVLLVLVLSVGSLLINFLEILWEPAKRVSFLSILHYYRPVGMLMRAEWPWRDLSVLGGVALAAWALAGVVTSRRAITTS
jgi:ABC-type transport system involved in multi-copper enzyme maturation permease subunit